MATKIKKGTEVYFISNWNDKGKVCVRLLTIQSIGAKRATATSQVNGEFIKQEIWSGQYGCLYPVADVDDVEALALDIAAKQKAKQIALCVNAVHFSYLSGNASDAYFSAMKQDCEEIMSDEIGVVYR